MKFSLPSEIQGIQVLIQEILTEDLKESGLNIFEGIFLTGSYARGGVLPYSDVDLIFVYTEKDSGRKDYELRYLEQRLISISRRTLHELRKEMENPVFVHKAFADAKVLFDARGNLQLLMKENMETKLSTSWIDDQVNSLLCGFVEEVHKVLNGLYANDISMLYNAILGLGIGMARTMATHYELLITTENSFYREIMVAVGEDTAWSRAWKQSQGIEPLDILKRGKAAILLFIETFNLVHKRLSPESQEFLATTMQLIQGFSAIKAGN